MIDEYVRYLVRIERGNVPVSYRLNLVTNSVTVLVFAKGVHPGSRARQAIFLPLTGKKLVLSI